MNYVIIPAFNEERKLRLVVEGCLEYTPNVIVVDDGSTDNTLGTILAIKPKHKDLVIISNKVNKGKGAALRDGCDYAFNHGAENIIVLDGDGQHRPRRIVEILSYLKEKDLVFTYRTFNKNMPLIFRIGNWFINTTACILFNIKVSDVLCGYKGFKAKSYPQIRWESVGYSIEVDISSRIKGLSMVELPIETIYHDRYKGTNVFDGIHIILYSLKIYVKRLLRWTQ